MAIAITGLLLTGCAAAPTSAGARDNVTTPAVDVQSSAPAESDPAQAAEPDVTAPSVGATVTTADEIAAAEAVGLGVYETSAGAKVVIDPAAPTSEAVLADVRATGGATTVALAENEAAAAARIEIARRAAEAGGKKLIFVVSGAQYGLNGVVEKQLYLVQAAAPELRGAGSNSETLEGALAIAQARIDAQADPSQYELVNLAG